MKFRIIGTLVVLVILGALYFFVTDEGQQNAPVNTQQVDPDANALRGLKIN